jgi:hypothetical protein
MGRAASPRRVHGEQWCAVGKMVTAGRAEQSRGGCFATQDSGREIQREWYARCLRRRCNERLKFWWDLRRIPVS